MSVAIGADTSPLHDIDAEEQRGLLLQLDECLQELDGGENLLLSCTAVIAINTYGNLAKEMKAAAEATRRRPPAAPKPNQGYGTGFPRGKLLDGG